MSSPDTPSVRRGAVVLTIALMAQGALFHASSRQEAVPQVRALKEFPAQVGAWRMVQEGTVEDEVQKVLQADDVITRHYASASSPSGLSFFVAYFRSQRTGKAPHSPKNCLPGSGWLPLESEIIEVPVAGRQPVQVNRYIVTKGEYKSLVLYWYQSHNRTIASEYRAKIALVVDSIRYNRSDTALVRIVVPIVADDVNRAHQAGTAFIQASYPTIRTYLPQ